jgi:hypothetical protein
MSKPTYEELQAQVEVLRIYATELVCSMTEENRQELHDIMMLTPAACLAQVRAEAIDDVWKKLHHRWKPDTDGDSAFVRVSEIKEMSESIRQGGTE